MKTCMKFLVGLALLTVPVARLSAQSLFASLTGIVSDPSGAVVPNAAVKLINENSGSVRDTVTDAQGYYSFVSVAVGNFTYKLTVAAQGFETFEATGLSIQGGEKRNLNVDLKVGAASATVEVTGVVSNIVPVDSGEKSETLSSKELTDYIQVAATRLSSSRSCRVSPSKTAPRTKRTTPAKLSASTPTAMPEAKARSTTLTRTTDCPAIRWTSPRTGRTFPIRVATATRR